ncbi:unnamed protein product [Dicrocoelium dendriticum]|nr:unnamed protein product [Dicrocoelium dendriticum]
METVILRAVLPAVLLLVSGVRYNGFSLAYFLFLLMCPLLPKPSSNHGKLRIQIFLIVLVTLSCIFTLSHPALHIILAVAPPYENALTSCEDITIASQIGLQRLNGLLFYRSMRLVVPDLVTLATAVGILVYISRHDRRAGARSRPISTAVCDSGVDHPPSARCTSAAEQSRYADVSSLLPLNNSAANINPATRFRAPSLPSLPFTRDWDDKRRKVWRAWAFNTLCALVNVLLVCITGITSPSVLSSVYLLCFLAIGTHWACRKRINPLPFAYMRIFLLVYSGLHVCLYYLYQFPFFQLFCNDGEFLARLLGLYYIMRTSCEKPGEISFPENVRTVDFVAPPLTLLLYYMLVFETRRWLSTRNDRQSFLFRNSQNLTPPILHWTANENANPFYATQETTPPLVAPLVLEQARYSADSSDAPNILATVAEISGSGKFTTNVATCSTTAVAPLATPQSDSVNVNELSAGNLGYPVTSGRGSVVPVADIEKSGLCSIPLVPLPPSRELHTSSDSHSRKAEKPHVKLSNYVTDRVQPHVDTLIGFTSPFVPVMCDTVNANNVRSERPLLLSLHCSAIRNSYIVTLIAMMAWAVAYRSWLSFILLLSACILWISPNSRTACLYASPLIVLYAIVLIVIQYVYGLNLTAEELPQEVTPDGMRLSELGMHKWSNSVGALSLQITFLVCFWLTLRLFINERSEQRLRTTTQANHITETSQWATPYGRSTVAEEPHTNAIPSTDRKQSLATVGLWFGVSFPFGNVDNSMYKKFTELLHALCVKFWIVVCCLSMLFISTQQPVVVFRIFYMVMLIYFMFTFQISYSFWRQQMIFFWWFLVVYSMAILLCIYTYQFQNSPELWQRTSGLSKEVLKDIGLETFASAALFERLSTPVIFLVIIILQVHYFHEPFLKCSALHRFGAPQSPRDLASILPISSSGGQTTQSHLTASSLPKPLRRLSHTAGRAHLGLDFIEDVNSAFHVIASKLTSWAISLSNCCWRFLEVHWIKLVALLTLLNSVSEVNAPNLVSLVLMVICFPFPYLHGFLATMMFLWTGLMTFCKMCFQLNFIQLNINVTCEPPPLNITYHIENATWIGLVKVPNFTQYIMPAVSLMAVCVSWHAIIYRQRQFYNKPCNERPREGIVFSHVTMQSLDNDLRNVVKFAINFGFYKFGLELCCCITVVTACLRVDAFSVLYLLLMLIFLFTPREVCSRLWLAYLTILMILIPIQYAGCVGLPPGLCWIFPWITDSVETDNLLQWLFLPGKYGSPTARKLTADFFQFVAVALQYNVFKIERTPFVGMYGGGSNKPVLINNIPGKGERDFVSSKESYMDYVRHLIFYWSYWVSLAIVLATGVTWITLFCLGYMILSFIYLWMGQNVMLRKRVNLIKSWNVIIGYNFCVILAKCSLQVVGCVYWASLSRQCWFIQLFGVQCMDPMSWSQFETPTYDKECTSVSSGLHWDVICFIFILFQRKVFMTQSFSHVVFDLNVQSQFASRGAYLFNRRLMSIISEQMEREERSLEKIREKLEAIQRRQAALGRNTANITEHYIMLRSGDYYLFEGDPEEDDETPSKEELKSESCASIKRIHRPSDHEPPAGSAAGILHSPFPAHLPSMRTGGSRSRALSIPQDFQAGTLNRSGGPSVGFVQDRWNYPTIAQRHPPLMSAVPHIEPSVMEILSNYTDPYSTVRSRPCVAADSDVLNAMNSNRFVSTESAYASGRAIGHRRMRSHPEFLHHQVGGAPVAQQLTGLPVEQPTSLLLPSRTTLRSVQTFPSPLVERTLTRAGGDPIKHVSTVAHTSTKRKPYQSHRRILSASAALAVNSSKFVTPTTTVASTRSVCDSAAHPLSSFIGVPTSPSGPAPLEFGLLNDYSRPRRKDSLPAELLRSKHRQVKPTELSPAHPGHNRTRFGDQPRRKISHGATISFPTPVDNEDQYSASDSEGDDDDDYDDANPLASSTSHVNPLQLLNRAMAVGASTTVRQYRHSLLPQSSSSRLRDQANSNVDVSTLDPRPAKQSGRRVSVTSHSDTIGLSPPVLDHVSSVQGLDRTTFSDPSTNATNLPVASDRSTNQSNRGFLRRKLRRTKLCSVASVEVEDEPILNDGFDMISSSEETHERQALVPGYGASTVRRRSSQQPRDDRHHQSYTGQSFVIKSTRQSTICQHPERETHQSLEALESHQQESESPRPSRSLVASEDSDGDFPHRRDGGLARDEIGAAAQNIQREEGCWSKFKAGCMIAYMFLISSVDSLIRFLNGLTRQYRRIRRTIELEKRLVKRNVINNAEQSEQSPLHAAFEARRHERSKSVKFDTRCFGFRSRRTATHANQHTLVFDSDDSLSDNLDYLAAEAHSEALVQRLKDKWNRVCLWFRRTASARSPPFSTGIDPISLLDIEVAVLKVVCKSPERHHSQCLNPLDCPMPLSSHFPEAQVSLLTKGHSTEQLHELDRCYHQREKAFRRSRSRPFLLITALGNLAIVYSEWFCYLLLILNHMRSSAILSLPYPLTVFLWGMLSVPRPTKTFWIFLITYTEIVIVIKYIFQFKFIYFNDPTEKLSESADVLWLPRLLGVDKHDHYALLDLVQLITLFLHRGFLRNDGLWRDHTEFAHDLELVTAGNKLQSKRNRGDRDHARSLGNESSDLPPANTQLSAHNQCATSTDPFPFSLKRHNTAKSWNPFVKLRRFYAKMTDPRYNQKVDVYIYMFLCEFISFWIMIFGYVSFGPSTGMGDNALEFIKSNRIPFPFISMLLVQFVFIIIDRGLFLRKQVLGKFIFQIIHVVLIHGWLFFILPHITKSQFTSGIAPQLLYLIKCIYFSLSAYQIRSGYPLRILGNFLTKNYNYINLVLFKGYLIIPFLYELRNVMDWMWTNSALSLYHWMELEDIYCKIFVLKCWRRSEIAYPTPRGVNRPVGKKALVGGLLLAFFFLCFWGPMTLSSFIGVTFDFNPPVLCTFGFTFAGFSRAFEFDSREGNILTIRHDVLEDFTRCHEKDQQTVGFLHNFESNDIRYITIDGFSSSIWAITPPSYKALLLLLAERNATLLLHFHMQCRRQTKEIQTGQTSVEDIFSRTLLWEEKLQLLHILNGTFVDKSISSIAHDNSPSGTIVSNHPDAVTLNAVIPRYYILRKDRLRTAFAKLGEKSTYVNVSFILHRDPVNTQSWWELKERTTTGSSDPCFERIRLPTLGASASSAKVLSIVTFNERVSDSLFGKVFSNYGIIGMYAAYIFLANRLLRTIYSNISYVICLEELPHVDRILNLCNEIYLVRENKLLRLEEQLVAKLFFLYRSSETMIKWTRHPKRIIDKFTDPAEPDPRDFSPPRSPLIHEASIFAEPDDHHHASRSVNHSNSALWDSPRSAPLSPGSVRRPNRAHSPEAVITRTAPLPTRGARSQRRALRSSFAGKREHSANGLVKRNV